MFKADLLVNGGERWSKQRRLRMLVRMFVSVFTTIYPQKKNNAALLSFNSLSPNVYHPVPEAMALPWNR